MNEISGVQKQYHQQFFEKLEQAHGIKLENIIYYKDSTHYFVMTATKDSLLNKGVLKNNFEERNRLLSPENINRQNLSIYAKEACLFATGQDTKSIFLDTVLLIIV